MSPPTNRPRTIFLTLEAQDVIELKLAMQDHDPHEAADLFARVVAPRVQEAALRRGIPLDEVESNYGRLPG